MSQTDAVVIVNVLWPFEGVIFVVWSCEGVIFSAEQGIC